MLQMQCAIARPVDSDSRSDDDQSEETPIVPLIIDVVGDQSSENSSEGSADDQEHSEEVIRKRETHKHLIAADTLISHERTPAESMEVAESHIFRPTFRSRVTDERIRTKKAIRSSVPGRKSFTLILIWSLLS